MMIRIYTFMDKNKLQLFILSDLQAWSTKFNALQNNKKAPHSHRPKIECEANLLQ